MVGTTRQRLEGRARGIMLLVGYYAYLIDAIGIVGARFKKLLVQFKLVFMTRYKHSINECLNDNKQTLEMAKGTKRVTESISPAFDGRELGCGPLRVVVRGKCRVLRMLRCRGFAYSTIWGLRLHVNNRLLRVIGGILLVYWE